MNASDCHSLLCMKDPPLSLKLRPNGAIQILPLLY